MKWPWSKPEVRSSSYTEQIVSQIMASASGAGNGAALAAVETAARLWGSGLASASVTPDTLPLRAVTPSLLDTVGRALCRSGESLHVISVSNGRVTLTPAASWTVRGTDEKAGWSYRCTLNGPDSTRTITLSGESVLHFRYASHPATPWAGRSPLRLAIDTARAAVLLEHATAGDFLSHNNNFSRRAVERVNTPLPILLTPKR